ncbi:MAG: ROK family protein [Alphaproteobacteria bacterium]|nr:ROK family protein [Alphaproteobacteria bacterium]
MRIGVDLGGTKIEAAALNSVGAIEARRRISTPRGDYAATVQAIKDLVGEVEREAGCDERAASVGIGIPGTIVATTGLVKNANSTWLNGRPFGRDIEAALGRAVRFANDANCFALSEAADGAATGCRVVFGVILGTGVGGGIVIDRQILVGANAIAGEWGHNPLPAMQPDEFPGPPCYCGRTGCIETFLSGPALVADHRRQTGVDLSGPEIVARAESGDAACRAGLDRYADRLARALAAIVNIIDPDAIVLGGGLSSLSFLYDAVPRRWGTHILSREIATRLLRPRHGDSSGVRGAAWLWPPEPP